MTGAPDGDGYLVVTLCKNGKPRVRRVHVIVAETFLGPRPPKYHINHLDGVKTNNAAANLEYCTPGENTRHAARNGLLVFGERHPMATIGRDTVIEIRRLAAKGHKPAHIAKRFALKDGHVRIILSGHIWASVPMPE